MTAILLEAKIAIPDLREITIYHNINSKYDNIVWGVTIFTIYTKSVRAGGQTVREAFDNALAKARETIHDR